MGQTRLKKKVDMLRQENKKLQEDLALLQYHLQDLRPSDKDQQEETSDLQTQQQQVETGSWVKLMSGTICPLDACLLMHPPLLSPITLEIHTPSQPPTSCTVIVHFSVFTQGFWEVNLL